MGGHFSSQNVETQTRNLVINSVSIYIYIYIYIRAEFEFGPKGKKEKRNWPLPKSCQFGPKTGSNNIKNQTTKPHTSLNNHRSLAQNI